MRAARASMRRNLVAGAAVMAVFAGGIAAWTVYTDVAGAVIAPGVLVVDSSVKKIQHQVGGIVAEIRVRNGDGVNAGDLLVRLDATTPRANLAIIDQSLDELSARRARLTAERDDALMLDLPPQLAGRASEPSVRKLLESERKVFHLRRSARSGQKAQIRERLVQLKEEIQGLDAQTQAKVKEIALIEHELKGVRELRAKNLVPLARQTALEREATRLEGERGQLVAGIARARAKTAETELQLIQVDEDLRSEVSKELRDVEAKLGELAERKIAAEDALRRIEIRAPADGKVHQLAVHTIGGVVGPGDTLMTIVPEGEQLVIEAKVSPHEIDRLRLGQPVLLRFTTHNQANTPELNGTLAFISADLVTDPRTGQSHYTVRVELAEEEARRLGSLKLIPGLPVEALIQTGLRSVASYLIKPISDQIRRAFRED